MTRFLVAVTFASVCVSAQAQSVEFKLKYTPGEKILVTTKEKIDQTINMGFPIKTGGFSSKVVEIATGKRGDKGGLSRTHTIKAMKNELSVPGGAKIVFDSTKPDATKVPEIPGAPGAGESMIAGMKNSAKAILTYTYDKANKLTGVKVTGLNVAELAPEVAAELSETSLKKSRQMQLDELPPKAMKPGDSWKKTREQPLGGGQILKTTTAYAYKGMMKRGDKSYDLIETKTTAIEIKVAEGSPLPLTGSDLKPTKESVGKIWYDRKAGRIAAAKSTLQAEGTITISAQGRTIDAQLNLTIERETEVKAGKESVSRNAK